MAENHHPGLAAPLRRHPRLVGAVLLLLLTIGFYWKLTATSEYLWMDSPDLSNQVLPWLEHQAREWHAGRFPAWEPHQWAGQPLIGQAQPGAANPLNWLLFLTPLKDGKLRQGYLDAWYVAMRYIAALNCFLLCWALRRSLLASLLAGCVFGFGGYVGNVDWPQMINGAIWSPLVFLFLLRETVYSAALAGFFLGLCWLSGHHQAPIFITYAAGGLWLWILWRRRQQALPALAAFGAFFFATAALQLLPAFDYGQSAKRWVGAPEPVGWNVKVPYQVHGEFSMRPWMILGFILPNLADLYKGFIGVTAFALATLAALTARQTARLFLAIGAFGFFIALGFATPFHGWLYAWAPMFEKARSPAAAVCLTSLAFAVLAAYGLDHLRQATAPALGRIIQVLTGAGTLIVAVFTVAGVMRGRDLIGDDRALLTGLVMLATAALFHAARHRRWTATAIGVSLLALILIENTNSSTFYWTSRANLRNDGFIQKTWQHDDIAAFLRSQPQPVRVIVDDKAIAYNFGDYHGIDTWAGYLASLTSNILRLDANHPKMQQALAVTHWVGSAPQNDQQVEVYASTSGLKVYRNPAPFPRVRVVRTLFPVRNEAEATQLLVNNLADFSKLAFVIGQAPALKLPDASCGEDKIKLLRDLGGLVEIDAELSCDGALIVGDIWAKGWQGSIDGRDAEVFEANGMLRGIIVPKGKHRVAMQYRPASLAAGQWLTGFAFAGILAWSLWRAKFNTHGDEKIRTEDQADGRQRR